MESPLKQAILQAFQKEFERLYGFDCPKELSLEIPPDVSLGDLAIPCFALSKILKKKPVEIARALSESLQKKSLLALNYETPASGTSLSATRVLFAAKKVPSGGFRNSGLPGICSISAAGPYVNFFLDPAFLARTYLTKKKISSKKKKITVVLEYVSPNTNKPLHLGHVRNAIIGDSIARILTAQGTKIVRTSLINDRGIHICKSMVAYQKQGKGKTPRGEGKKGDHFVGEYYVLFEKMLKENPSLADAAQECLKKWEIGDKKTRALWKKMNAWVLQGMSQTYKRMGIRFDTTYFESDIFESGREIIMKGVKKEIFSKDETGAISANLSAFCLPNKVLMRSNGTALYITQDIFLAVKKWRDFHAAQSLYVIGSEQELYLKQLFAILKQLGYPWASNCVHVSYGMVNLPEGKMKSREGTVVDADDVLDTLEGLVREETKKRDAALSEKELTRRAKNIALAALKYYMVSVHTASPITFNPKESIALQGRTGPYILYTYARLKSIIGKASVRPSINKKYAWSTEKRLLVLLTRFEETLHTAAVRLEPSLLAQYLFDLSQCTNDYYHTTHILNAPEAEKRARLALIIKIAETLSSGCTLLGIPLLERM